MRSVNILGVTGSIGQSTLNVIEKSVKDTRIRVNVLSANQNITGLAKSALKFDAKYAVTTDDKKYKELKDLLAGSSVIPVGGSKAFLDLLSGPVDWTMNAIVGFAGLKPSLLTAESGGVLALANKESLVCAGDLLVERIESSGSTLLPVDSEHSAIFQCLRSESLECVDKLILTASGGPFRGWNLDDMQNVTLKQAIAHPNWSMGAKISIDSATMFNKALEVIEAKYLFHIKPSKIDVIVHPQSIIHSMVSFCDGAVLAQLGVPDMRGAIGFAFNYPQRVPLSVKSLNFLEYNTLTFEKVDEKRFPALNLAYYVLKEGGVLCTVLNAAKEVALDRFINGQIKFLDIVRIVDEVLQSQEISKLKKNNNSDLDQVFFADSEARRVANLIKLD